MKNTLLLGTLVLLVAWPALGQNVLPRTAKSYVERAAYAMGGKDLLSSIKAVRLQYRGHSYLLDESERPDGPWLVTYENDVELRDYERCGLRREKEHWFLTSTDAQRSSVTIAMI